MRLYFVRHGETDFNVENRHQPPDSKLSQKGIRQAHSVANRFTSIPIGVVFSSDYDRARHTAEIINEVIQKKLVLTNLLRERRRPSETVGHLADEPAMTEIDRLIIANAHDPLWHYSDEENLSDMVGRAKKFFAEVSERGEKHILAVTHGMFLRVLISTIIFGETIPPKYFYHFIHAVKSSNTGITLCERRENGMWRLLAWNDHAHLGE